MSASTGDRRAANRAVAVSAIGLAGTGLIELLLAIVTGSVGLLGDAIHNLSDVSTSAQALCSRVSRASASSSSTAARPTSAGASPAP